MAKKHATMFERRVSNCRRYLRRHTQLIATSRCGCGQARHADDCYVRLAVGRLMDFEMELFKIETMAIYEKRRDILEASTVGDNGAYIDEPDPNA